MDTKKGLGMRVGFSFIIICLLANLTYAENLHELSLEELMNETVVSVSNKDSSLKETPAAVYVITSEDIKKSGFKTVPDVLRLVPGIHVAQISSNTWAVSARGFSTRYAEKMQVLIDGQSVYSNLFSGVHWDTINRIMEDIDRIEVIRGPGATLWGANAVNGVINIITKNSRDTQGGYFEMGAGSNEQAFGALRWGDKFSEDITYRIYTQANNYGPTDTHSGDERMDDWHVIQGGARVDWSISDFTELSLQADYLSSDDIGADWSTFNTAATPAPSLAFPNLIVEEDQYARSANLLLKLSHEFSPSHKISIQTDYLGSARRTPIGDNESDTYNFEFKHFYKLDQYRHLAWGLGVRAIHDEVIGTPTFTMDSEHEHYDTYSGFIEYSTDLQPDKLTLILGTKLEENSYTGFEIQPNVRLSYKLSEKSVLWTAYSHVVRAPARFEEGAVIRTAALVNPATLPYHSAIQINGNSNVESEVLDAYEIGFRTQLKPELSLDVAVFYNDYSDYNVFETDQASVLDPTTPIIQNVENTGSAYSYGFESSVKWQANDDLRLGTTYAFFEMDVDGPDHSYEEITPSHMLNLHSSYDITKTLSFHLHAYYQDSIAESGIEQFTRVDSGLIWKARPNLEFSLWGQNLLDPRHEENEDPFFSGGVAQIPRSVYAQMSMTF